MLDFLVTPKNLVILTSLGNKLLDADINARKAILAKQLRRLGTFRFVIQILDEAKGKHLPKDVVQEELVMRMPTEDIEPLFDTVVSWGRFAELFVYDAKSEMLSLEESPFKTPGDER